MSRYHIKRVVSEREEAYCLCDPNGNIVPHQVKTSLSSEGGCIPHFVVTFEAGTIGLPVVGDEDAPTRTT